MDLYIYIGAVVLLAVASMVFTVFKTRPAVQVVVRCGAAVVRCVEAVERAIRRRRP